MYLLLALVLSALDVCSSETQPWSYNDQAHWPELCLHGRRQSPVSIDSSRAVLDYFGKHIRTKLHFTRYNIVKLRGMNDGHTVRFTVEGEPALRPALSGGPLRRQYSLVEFHFHWPAEHTVDTIRYPLEIHFVHYRSDLTMEEATRQSDGVVVVAVFCKLSPNDLDDAALRRIVKYVPALENVNATVQVDGEVDLLRVLSPVLDSYYTYEGSLTTPDCLEIVTWIVMDKPIRFTDKQYKAFRAVNVGGVANSRNLQPLYGRIVFRTPPNLWGAPAVPPGLTGGTHTWPNIVSGNANALLEKIKNAVNSSE